MSPLELFYFDGAGRANLTRLALVAGGVAFTDTRVADWPTLKSDPTSVPSQLFGSLPCLRHGDLMLAQSIALAAYAAELGLYQRDPAPSAAARAADMMVVVTNEELKQVMYKCLFGDDASKAAGKEALPAAASKLLGALERTLERKTVQGPFFHGTTLSLADLAVFDSVESPFPGLKALGVDLTPYPKLVACAQAVGQDETIKAFVEKGWKL